MKSVFNLISNFIAFYSVLIWIRVLITWLPSQRNPNNTDSPFIAFFKSVTDPFLDLFRFSKANSALDFSPLLALMTLNILQSVFKILALTGQITIGVIIVLVIQGVWTYFLSFMLILLCILLIIRYISGKRANNPNVIAFLSSIDPVLRKPVNFAAYFLEFFVRKRKISDQSYVLFAFFFYLAIYFGIKQGLKFLLEWIVNSGL